jgi:hypothetical protein
MTIETDPSEDGSVVIASLTRAKYIINQLIATPLH